MIAGLSGVFVLAMVTEGLRCDTHGLVALHSQCPQRAPSLMW